MKNAKRILIVLLILLILMLILLFFKNELFSFLFVKEYEHKYKDINLVEKNLYLDKTQNIIEENTIDINNLKITLSDFYYNKDEKKLEFDLEFSNENSLNNVGYILRVYNTEYCLGDRFNGQISLNSAIEYIISYNKFYEENFGVKNRYIDLVNCITQNNDLLSKCNMLKQDELMENGNLVHQISFELPEEFVINDILNIELFDLNYQNIGEKTVYQVQEPLTQVRYTINFGEN